MAELILVDLEDLLEMSATYPDLPFHLIEKNEAGSWRWGTMKEYVIQRASDGKFFAGIVRFTTHDGPEDGIDSVDMHEVIPVEVIRREWKKVE